MVQAVQGHGKQGEEAGHAGGGVGRASGGVGQASCGGGGRASDCVGQEDCGIGQACGGVEHTSGGLQEGDGEEQSSGGLEQARGSGGVEAGCGGLGQTDDLRWLCSSDEEPNEVDDISEAEGKVRFGDDVTERRSALERDLLEQNVFKIYQEQFKPIQQCSSIFKPAFPAVDKLRCQRFFWKGPFYQWSLWAYGHSGCDSI